LARKCLQCCSVIHIGNFPWQRAEEPAPLIALHHSESASLWCQVSASQSIGPEQSLSGSGTVHGEMDYGVPHSTGHFCGSVCIFHCSSVHWSSCPSTWSEIVNKHYKYLKNWLHLQLEQDNTTQLTNAAIITQRFITTFITLYHWTQNSASPMQVTSSKPSPLDSSGIFHPFFSLKRGYALDIFLSNLCTHFLLFSSGVHF